MRRVARTKTGSLAQRLDRLALALARANLGAFSDLWQRPRRMLWLNFLAGLARGFGIAVGLTMVAAVFFSLLGRAAQLNLPVIGRYIAEIVRLVQTQLRNIPR
ncbi:MAG: DUF5665 domain-containing protein [Patescibacteria group bacterium]